MFHRAEEMSRLIQFQNISVTILRILFVLFCAGSLLFIGYGLLIIAVDHYRKVREMIRQILQRRKDD